MLFGVLTGVSGAISLASAGIGRSFQVVDCANGGYLAGMMLDRAVYGCFSLVAGVLLFRWDSRGVLRAA